MTETTDVLSLKDQLEAMTSSWATYFRRCAELEDKIAKLEKEIRDLDHDNKRQLHIIKDLRERLGFETSATSG